MPILSSAYYYYLFIIIESNEFFNDVLQNYCNLLICSTWNFFAAGKRRMDCHKTYRTRFAVFVSRGTLLNNKTQKAALRRLFVFFQGNVSFGEAKMLLFYITVGADAKHAGAAQKFNRRNFPPF
ncbi:MAG: hypothetical protein E7479_04325 [Ruminococcaceae bacterium]|nr:hypothetical protein [Oscillospiraceae bacterium]